MWAQGWWAQGPPAQLARVAGTHWVCILCHNSPGSSRCKDDFQHLLEIHCGILFSKNVSFKSALLLWRERKTPTVVSLLSLANYKLPCIIISKSYRQLLCAFTENKESPEGSEMVTTNPGVGMSRKWEMVDLAISRNLEHISQCLFQTNWMRYCNNFQHRSDV